jgi:hypothetical protein
MWPLANALVPSADGGFIKHAQQFRRRR